MSMDLDHKLQPIFKLINEVNYILADKQDVTRAGITSYINDLDDENVIYEVYGYEELLDLLRKVPDAIVVVDYSLFDFQSLNHMLNTKSGAKQSQWLLFTDDPQANFIRQLLLADQTVSVVLKHNSGSEVIEALKCVIAGDVYWCDFAESAMKSEPAIDKIMVSLTASEKSVLHEIALGKTTKEIATEKYLSFHTVNTHRRNIYRKLGVNSVNEATRYALQAGLIDLMEYYI